MVYKVTKPRGRIAAMDSSPGPCYALPGLMGQSHHDPRSVHARGPAYAFGSRHRHEETGGASPGPCYLPDTKMYRTGRDGAPRYSMSARTRAPLSDSSPGPAAYAAETSGTRPNTPAYSLGSRPRTRGLDDIPGPNRYAVPSLLGGSCLSSKPRAPAYSLAGRCSQGSFHEDLRRTPGPGAYDVVAASRLRREGPSYSLGGRCHSSLLGDDTRKPGPGAHSNEKVWAHKREPPHFSFGVRHSPYVSTLTTADDNCC